MSEARLLLTGLLAGSGLLCYGQGRGAAGGQHAPAGAAAVLLESELGDQPRVVLELHAGDYLVRRSPDRRLRVLETREAGNTARATKTQVLSRHRQLRVEVDPPSNDNGNGGTHVVVEVPRCAELEASLTAGELRVEQSPCEEASYTMHAGELVANLGEPGQYREVKATVSIGQVTAEGFDPKGGGDHGGFFPSYRWQGPGVRRVAAHVGTGQIKLEH